MQWQTEPNSLRVAIIGGSGLNRFTQDGQQAAANIATPYGPASASPAWISLADQPALFLARHGQPHRLAPHQINYRANIWLLAQLGVQQIVAVNAVGGIAPEYANGDLVVPDQLIDYSWGRESSFSDASQLLHLDFTHPFTPTLRNRLLAAGAALSIPLHDGGVYACTQGPRLETAAEVQRLARDGCTLVGMTAMPEAILARELGMDYASLCLVVNPAAGLGAGPIREEDMAAVMQLGMGVVVRVLAGLVSVA